MIKGDPGLAARKRQTRQPERLPWSVLEELGVDRRERTHCAPHKQPEPARHRAYS